MAPGEGNKFDAPVLEPEIFRSKFTALKKELLTWLRLFDSTRSDLTPHRNSAPREMCPLSSLVTPLCHCHSPEKGAVSLQLLFVVLLQVNRIVAFVSFSVPSVKGGGEKQTPSLSFLDDCLEH